MAAKSSAFRNELLQLIFNNVIPAGGVLEEIAIRNSLVAGNLELSLHTASPGIIGTQATNQCAYTGYAPKTLARSSGAWTVTGNSVSPNANQDFGKCTAGSETATYAAISTETGKLVYFGLLSPAISISAGVIPRIEVGSTITED